MTPVVAIFTNSVALLERFVFAGPFFERPVGPPALNGLALVPAEYEAAEAQLLGSMEDLSDGDVKLLASNLAEHTKSSRLWLTGHTLPLGIELLAKQQLVREPESFRDRPVWSPLYFATRLDTRQADWLTCLDGITRLDSWTLHFFEGRESASEQLLHRCMGVSEGHPNSEVPIFSPDWLPLGAFYDGCLAGARAVMRRLGEPSYPLIIAADGMEAGGLAHLIRHWLPHETLVLDGNQVEMGRLEPGATLGLPSAALLRDEDGPT